MSTSLHFMAEQYLILWIGHHLLIHSLTDRWLCCSLSSAIMNHTAMIIHVQVFVGPQNTHILLVIYLGVKVLSHKSIFNFLGNCQDFFHKRLQQRQDF